MLKVETAASVRKVCEALHLMHAIAPASADSKRKMYDKNGIIAKKISRIFISFRQNLLFCQEESATKKEYPLLSRADSLSSAAIQRYQQGIMPKFETLKRKPCGFGKKCSVRDTLIMPHR